MQKKLMLILSAILLIMLNSCSCSKEQPMIITKYKTVSLSIPKEYLTPVDAPSAILLEKVEIKTGSTNLIEYLKDLYDANFQNSLKIQSINTLLTQDLNVTGLKQ